MVFSWSHPNPQNSSTPIKLLLKHLVLAHAAAPRPATVDDILFVFSYWYVCKRHGSGQTAPLNHCKNITNFGTLAIVSWSRPARAAHDSQRCVRTCIAMAVNTPVWSSAMAYIKRAICKNFNVQTDLSTLLCSARSRALQVSTCHL